VRPRLSRLVHSTSPAPAARRARVAGGAEEPLLARRVRSSKRRRHDAYAAPRRRRTRARSRRLSLRLREQLCSPARTPRCRSPSAGGSLGWGDRTPAGFRIAVEHHSDDHFSNAGGAARFPVGDVVDATRLVLVLRVRHSTVGQRGALLAALAPSLVSDSHWPRHRSAS